jgi:hypothetical protein
VNPESVAVNPKSVAVNPESVAIDPLKAAPAVGCNALKNKGKNKI